MATGTSRDSADTPEKVAGEVQGLQQELLAILRSVQDERSSHEAIQSCRQLTDRATQLVLRGAALEPISEEQYSALLRRLQTTDGFSKELDPLIQQVSASGLNNSELSGAGLTASLTVHFAKSTLVEFLKTPPPATNALENVELERIQTMRSIARGVCRAKLARDEAAMVAEMDTGAHAFETLTEKKLAAGVDLVLVAQAQARYQVFESGADSLIQFTFRNQWSPEPENKRLRKAAATTPSCCAPND